MLINLLYSGMIVSKKWSKAIRGDFEPLVAQQTFDKVQGILTGRSPYGATRPR